MRLAILLAACLLVAAPATAHTTVPAAEGQLCITVGSLNEPISTFVQSGLDLIVRENLDPGGDCASADRGDEVADFHNSIAVTTAISPSGAERDLMAIKVQHGQVGRYTSAEPYQWTEPGQYMLRLDGEWNGASFAGDYKIAGEVDGIQAGFHPPLEDGATVAALQARITALEADMDAMQTHMDAMMDSMRDDDMDHSGTATMDDNGVPAAPMVWVGLALVGLAFVARRR